MDDAPLSPPTAPDLARAFEDFGLQLLERLPADESAFFSPVGIAAALTALLAGARGRTADQLATALGVPPSPEALSPAVSDLRRRLAPRWSARNEELFALTLATALFVEEAFPLRTDYCTLLSEAFDADFFSVSFSDRDAAAERINRWIAAKTRGRIPSLVSGDGLTDTSLVLANAVYFRAAWLQPFLPVLTRPRPFHRLDGSTVEVPTMRQTELHGHWEGEEVQAVDIRYLGGVSMLVLLPAHGALERVGRRLGSGLLRQVTEEMRPRDVALELPRWTLRRRTEFGPLLKELGAMDPFDRATADFSGVTPHRGGLSVSDIVHEAWVHVDEEGTEAAAATAGIATLGGFADPPPPIPFVVDRPFYVFIRDGRTSTTLFMGRVLDPS